MMKTALITGTTSGIGYHLCNQFAENGINLVLVSRCKEKLVNQQKELQDKYGIQVSKIECDLATFDSAEKVITQLENQGIHIDYLVNNAGFNEVGNFLDTNLANEIGMIQLHITFVTKLTKYLLSAMVQKQYGRILNVASTGSYVPCPNDIVYTATKSYLLSFTKGLSAELKGTGITATVVCPGATKSNFATKAGIDKSLLFKLFVMDSNYVARKSYKALMSGKREKIIGIYNKVLIFSSSLLPTWLINTISFKMMK